MMTMTLCFLVKKHNPRSLRCIPAALLLLLAATQCWGESPAGYFAGRTPDGRGLWFTLMPEQTNVLCTLHLEGNPDFARFSGVVHPSGGFDASSEWDSSSERQPVTGLRGKVSGEPTVFSGFLLTQTNTNGIPVVATNIARMQKEERRRGGKVAGRGGGTEFSATWPDFQRGTPFQQSVSARLAAESRGEVGKFISGGLGVAWEGLKDGGASWSWTGSLDTHVSWLSDNLVSLEQDRYEDTGGAHGNTTLVGRNFVFIDRKAREFTLPDLFAPGSAWEGVLSEASLAELRRQEASAVTKDGLKRISAAEMAVFTLDRAGLVIHFETYKMGSHAEGTYRIHVPWTTLRPWLNPKGPTRWIPGALGPEANR